MKTLQVDLRSAPAIRRRRSRSPLIAGLALAAMVVLVGDVFAIIRSNQARPVTLGTALRRFRNAEQRDAGRSVPASGGPAGPAAPRATAAATTAAAAGAGPLLPAVAGRASAAASAPAAATVSPARAGSPAGPAAAVPFTLPPAGVYAYRTSGGEQLNVPGSARSYPSLTYATLTYKGGCEWELENDVIQQHTDRRWSCSSPGQETQLGQGRTVTYYGKTEGYDYWCRPPLVEDAAGDTADTARDGVCADSQGDKATLREVDLGVEQMTVGATPVSVVHLLLTSTLSGMATGSARDELWLSVQTGMIVSWHRSVDTWANGAFGIDAHYQEQATFDLVSLQPRT